MGFNEFALDFANHTSYRQAVRMLNRVRNEKDRPPCKNSFKYSRNRGRKSSEINGKNDKRYFG